MGVFPPRQFEAGVAIRSREGTCPVEGYRPIRLLICDGRFVEKFDDGYVRISEGNLLLTGIQEISSTDEVPPELAAHTLGLVTVTQGEVTFGIALPRHRLPEIDLLTLGL